MNLSIQLLTLSPSVPITTSQCGNCFAYCAYTQKYLNREDPT